MKKITIAIDGFSSCGKSTMAKQLAAELGYAFVDSGAMYRAITLYFLQHHVDCHDEDQVRQALDHIKLSFAWNRESQQSDIMLNGVVVAAEIREMQVAMKVSDVAALVPVRRFAVAQQQQMGLEKGIVMDGRDVGTVVFPDAELKIFVTASIEVRTQRRYDELKLKDPNISMDEVRSNLLARDYTDSNRKEGPLRQADDAVLLDNSDMSREEQLQLVLHWARAKMGIS
ncbi:MAG: (d)CMP kinase [Chitinophagaceae bacterium]|nr:(d)CMP kinase [Chitinophagaceae bacterium]